MFIVINIQCCQGISSSQLSLKIYCDPNQNLSKLFYAYQQINSKFYIKGPEYPAQYWRRKYLGEQNWRTASTQPYSLLYKSYSYEDSTVLMKEQTNRSME